MRHTLVAAAAFLSVVSPTLGKPGVEEVATGFNRPVWVGAPNHVKDRLWVMEQEGKIWIIDSKSGEKQKELFLDITEQVSRKGNEEGLLGLAFAPDFEKSGRFYVNFTDKQRNTRISRFVSKAPKFDTADKDGQEVLLSFKQPYENHNGGCILFGPDGMLYVGNGDGGAGNDPPNNGQKKDTYLGKMLRLDVSGKSGYEVPKDNPFVGKDEYKPEIWALGLRNPWRFSFDRKTGDLWIGDVGQNNWEEIDYLPKGKGAGSNFGWRLREGDKETPEKGVGGDKPDDNVEPVHVYPRKDGVSVTGGYVYRGPVKDLEGRYIFGDFQSSRVWSFILKGGRTTDFEEHTGDFKPEKGRLGRISSFGEDPQGNLYIVDHGGPIFRIVDK